MPKYLLHISYKYGFPIARPLSKEIKTRGFDVVWFLDNLNDKKYLKADDKYLESIEDVLNYNPDIILSSSNEVPHFFPGIKVQLFHGFSVNKRNKNKGHFRIRGWFDLYCTQGPSTTQEFKKLEKKHQHFKVVETGWSKVDMLFPLKKNQSEKPVVFIASTFTEALSLAHNAHFYKKIESLIKKNDKNWIINLHPKMCPNIVEKFKTLTKHNNVKYIDFLEDLSALQEADIMITDTTSMITEFILQKKPVITFNNRVPMSYMINITNEIELDDAIKRGLSPTEELIKNIELFINNEHPYFDGKSSKRVIDASHNFFLNNEKNSLKRKPLNLIRKIKLRKKYNYFKKLWL